MIKTQNIKSNEQQNKPDAFNIIVIGASAGGFEGIKTIVKALPADFHPPIFIVWHTGSQTFGVMPSVLNKLNSIAATHATDNEEIQPNHIYVAPPDYHLLLEDGIMKLGKGPKENHFRPAVDPLFRSAAYNYGNRVIGIVLSGALDDGTAGLWHIKSNGGIAIVQDPDDAEVPSMPENALREVEVDYSVPLIKMADLLIKLANADNNLNNIPKNELTEAAIKSSEGDKDAARQSFEMGEISPLTCPECHGVLSKITNKDFLNYRCHTGHVFSADSLLSALTQRIENNLYTALAGMDETIALLNHMGDHLAEINHPQTAAVYFIKAKETEAHADGLRRIIKNY